MHYQPIWYFAYGSNLARSIFTGTRKIIPLATKSVSIPGWTLVFDIGGLPYIEPAFASIQPVSGPSIGKGDLEKNAPVTAPTVEGVAYLVTPAQLRSIMASEGGLYAYRRVVLRARPLDSLDGDASGMAVVTLVTGEGRTPAGVPSRRYMDLITTGSGEQHLSHPYQTYLSTLPSYQPPIRDHSPWQWFGAQLFLLFWLPLYKVLQWLLEMTGNMDPGGHAPEGLCVLVRTINAVMWFWHDRVHSRVWGRGDGLL
ncbi:hypothetical protein P168DRAFT_326463 [Aspergillus campestris IBT 28561]|uniref:gamma-glutamylcyclotransferase n=1 Tax=Aspergillus campestris (strain IBT 28561) TaxID=1392248 RepID=A0A2I1D453_ASPC2|nr:uncharacterized protein P168DRAFT_326463 [Aspergillus campestris IBT 28561]PKY04649.1 hypothetical protein P168DRAFT_326463 [Aspergillus campestris IBT 28561]